MTRTIDEPVLSAGDLAWVDLRPGKGREQDGVRPVVVLTGPEFHERNATAIVCPITSNMRPWPTKVVLPEGLPITGAVLTDQVRCVDRASRGFRRIGTVPDVVLREVRVRVAILIGALPGADTSIATS